MGSILSFDILTPEAPLRIVPKDQTSDILVYTDGSSVNGTKELTSDVGAREVKGTRDGKNKKREPEMEMSNRRRMVGCPT